MKTLAYLILFGFVVYGLTTENGFLCFELLVQFGFTVTVITITDLLTCVRFVVLLCFKIGVDCVGV